MTKTLDVYLNENLIGHLIQDKQGEMNFTYTNDWLQNPQAIPISCSLPLQKETFKRKNCTAFFGGILPEDYQRKLIAKNLGISANNDFSMLEKIGGECAGAISFIPAGEKINSNHNEYHELTSDNFFKILKELPSRPLLAGDHGVRLSLAGVQDKLAVFVKNGRISIPLYNSPSTHILKPDFNTYPGVIFNELFCLNLARQIGLTAVEAEIKQIEDIHYLLIKRYDRVFIDKETNSQTIQRLHQEDFCQALGISSINKYQNEGGPSLKQCFDLIRKESYAPIIDLEKMLSIVIFNYLIGNCDAHGKNFSLLYLNNLQLAPFYDLICTHYYRDLSQKMAMKLGGEYDINHIRSENFDKLAHEIGFAKPQVHRRIISLIDAILSSLSTVKIQHTIQEEIASHIKKRCEKFI